MQIFVKLFLFLAIFSFGLSLPAPEASEADSSARIVNGFEVDINEVPYQAALRRRVTSGWAHMCGGSIITVRAVLTAAHCVTGYVSDTSSIKVVVGTSYRLSGGKSYDVSKINVHNSYDTTTLNNDIAMIVTAKKMSFSQSVNAITFAPSNLELPDGTEALVSGYGITSYEGKSSSVLLAAKVNITSQETCSRAYLRIASITSNMICATASHPPRDACQGDSGGPLVSKNFLVGIVSWGEGCAEINYPGVYTRVSKYNSWIHENLGQIY